MEMDTDEEISEEGRTPIVQRDPGAPSLAEFDQQNMSHLPYRACSPACVAGRACGAHHKLKEGKGK